MADFDYYKRHLVDGIEQTVLLFEAACSEDPLLQASGASGASTAKPSMVKLLLKLISE